MDIPDAVRATIPLVAKYLWYVNGATLDEVKDRLTAMCGAERFTYQPSAAALIIAARPHLLEPETPSFMCDLPTWSGRDHPYRLVIGAKDDEYLWTLYDEEGVELFKIDTFDELAKLIAKRSRRRKK
jgi:hypothetical protein